MSEELKPCPFCGRLPMRITDSRSRPDEATIVCETNDCPIAGRYTPIVNWNRRADAELTAARAEIARLTQERDDLRASLREMLDAAESAGWNNAEVHNARSLVDADCHAPVESVEGVVTTLGNGTCALRSASLPLEWPIGATVRVTRVR